MHASRKCIVREGYIEVEGGLMDVVDLLDVSSFKCHIKFRDKEVQI